MENPFIMGSLKTVGQGWFAPHQNGSQQRGLATPVSSVQQGNIISSC